MAHALLGPSGASRWLACPPSARLSENYPDKAGEAAAEGTLAHRLAELRLMFIIDKISKFELDKTLHKEVAKSEYYSPSMEEYVSQYIAYVMESYHAAGKGAQIFLEQRFDLTHIIPNCFGTSDVSIIADGTLHIIDLKFGKGVPVYAEDNPQAKLYALGVLELFSMVYDIHTVKITIHQPRLDNVSEWEISVADLQDWAENEVKPKAAQAWDGTGEFNPSEKACKFCKAKGSCKALAEYAMHAVGGVGKKELTNTEIAVILERAKVFTDWLSAVQESALEKALAGDVIPSFKLVEGRSNRRITDKEAAVLELSAAGYDETDYFKPKELKSLGELEELAGKSNLSRLLNGLIEKPTGKPTLVPEHDKRATWSPKSTALEDFKDV